MTVQVYRARPVDRTARIRRRGGWRVAAVLSMLCIVRVLAAAPAAYALDLAAPPSPVTFACATPTVFNAAGTPTRLFAQTPGGAGGPGSGFTPVGGASGVQYNAIAFNAADRLIYAVTGPGGSLPTGHLVVVDATGAVFDRGAISGIPGTDLAAGVSAGSFDDAGGLWVSAAGAAGSGLVYRVDLATRVAVPLAGQTVPVRALDLTFAQGFLWGAGSSSTVVRVDLKTGAVTAFGVPSLAAGPFPAAWTYADGHLGFDSVSGVVYELAIGQPSAAAPSFTLIASHPGLASNANDGTSCTPREVDLAIDTAGPTRRAPGSRLTWTVTVQNRGTTASSGFVVNDVVPPGYTGLSSATPGCSLTGHAVRCQGTGLAAGARTVLVIAATAPLHDECSTNTASVVGADPDPIPANNTSSLRTCVSAGSRLTLVQTASLGASGHSDGLARVGDVVTFSFLVTNKDEEPLYAVSVRDRLAGPGGPVIPVTCPRSSLLAGQSMTCSSSQVVTQAEVDAASLTSSAVATGRSPEGDAVVSSPSTASVATFLSVGLRLDRHVVLLVDLNHNHRVDPGDQVSWRLVATNVGSLTLRGVAVNDGLLAAAGIVVACPRTVLAPLESMTCVSPPRTLTRADLAPGAVVNALLGSGLTLAEGQAESESSDFPGTAPTVANFGGGEVVGSQGSPGALAFTGMATGIGRIGGLGLGLALVGSILGTLARRARRGVNPLG